MKQTLQTKALKQRWAFGRDVISEITDGDGYLWFLKTKVKKTNDTDSWKQVGKGVWQSLNNSWELLIGQEAE